MPEETIKSQIFSPNILNGQVAIVTGGGTGICKGIAEELLKHGCRVAIFGRRENVLSEKTGMTCLAVACDVRSTDMVKKGVTIVANELGPVDILLNGAAGNFLIQAHKMSVNAFRTVVDIDLTGTYQMSREVYNQFVVVVCNLQGTPLQAHAGSAKAGIDALTLLAHYNFNSSTRHLAVEWGPSGVTVNAVAPGPIGVRRLVGTIKNLDKKIPMQRLGQPVDIANYVIYLASPAGKWITGTVQPVDGGQRLTASNPYPYPACLKAKL